MQLHLHHPDFMSLFRLADRVAFKLVFDEYYLNLVFFASKRTGYCFSDCEDLVINAFEKVFLNRERYESIEHIKRSLFKILINSIIDKKRNSKNKLLTSELFEFAHLAEEKEDISDKEEMIHILLSKFISRLDKCRKRIIINLFYDNLTTAEISDRYNISHQTVRNTKTHAIEFLRKEFIKHKHLYECPIQPF